MCVRGCVGGCGCKYYGRYGLCSSSSGQQRAAAVGTLGPLGPEVVDRGDDGG